MELELKKLFKTNRKYSLNEICKILKHYDKEDIKNKLADMELDGSVILINDKYQIFPSGFEVANIKIDKNGCGYFCVANKKYFIKQKYLNGCLNDDLCLINMDSLSVSKVLKRKSNLLMCSYIDGNISIVDNNQNYNIIIGSVD